jgi:glucokinase
MSERLAVGVDIGGTKVAAGFVNARGEILRSTRMPMVATQDAAAGLSAVTAAIQHLLNETPPADKVIAIGVCCPGPLNPRTGMVINPPNLPCWRQFPLAEEIGRAFSVPVKVDNDANAAALAETLWGAGRGYRNVFYATIGTGIGTGVILGGKIYHGRTGAAGEGGHMGIDPNGPLCPCGKRGCIELLASGPAIARRARAKMAEHTDSELFKLAHGNAKGVTSEMVGQAYSAGDVVAIEVVRETLDPLAYWLGNIIDLLDPDVIVIGGGISAMLQPLLPDIRLRFQGACLNPCAGEIPLVLARYGADAGIAGAAALVGTGELASPLTMFSSTT